MYGQDLHPVRGHPGGPARLAAGRPRSDSDLARLLLDGVPARSIIWLDELQDKLPATPAGITAAKAIDELLQGEGLGPILVAGTIWPANLATMRARPDPAEAKTGAGAIPALLQRAIIVAVPDVFTDADLDNDTSEQDARLQHARSTATHTQDGIKLTQVLAGGAQLIDRLYPPPGTHPVGAFSPAARAVLHAAADLRRVGLPNPIPGWAVTGAAPGYLDPPDLRPPAQWLERALVETTLAATDDDPLTGTRRLDIHHEGVPALTPTWTATPDGEQVEGYELHDYLLQDHLTRHRHTPTKQALWDTLTSRPHPPDTADALAHSAENRGLLTPAIALLRPHADTGDRLVQYRLAYLLADRGDTDALAELRTRADTGDEYARDRLAGLLADRGDPDSLAELRALVHGGYGGLHLLRRYRAQDAEHHVQELDCDANPVYSP